MLKKDVEKYKEFKEYLEFQIEYVKNITIYQNDSEGFNKILDIFNEIYLYLIKLDSSLHKTIRLSDGFIIKISDNLWCKLIGNFNDIYGYAIYDNSGNSTRLILDKKNKSLLLSKLNQINPNYSGWEDRLKLEEPN